MLITTTSSLEGKVIKEYRGVVFGEVISGIHFINDFTASITNFVGGRSEEYEQELVNARADAINEMIEKQMIFNNYIFLLENLYKEIVNLELDKVKVK